MSITYQCERCGRWSTVAGSKAGTVARCVACDHRTVVPDAPEIILDDLDMPAAAPGPAYAVARPVRSLGPGPATGRPGVASKPPGPSMKTIVGGALSALGFIVLVGFWVLIDHPFPIARPNRPPPPPAGAAVSLLPDVNLVQPIQVPEQFPDLGPGEPIAPGVLFHEVQLRPIGDPSLPGHAGRLWLYLPSEGGKPRPGPLPCVLIAPAGSTGLNGMNLAEADRPEHLPYVEAGFAVLSFDLDGGSQNNDRLDLPAMTRFYKARAGLVNGRIAIEFLKAKVPWVDPDRLYVAGQSSAGSFALILTAHEPSLRACVAYAPAVDMEARVLKAIPQAAAIPGLLRVVNQFSPRNIEPRLNTPTLLFAIRDDEAVPFSDVADSAARLKALGKPIVFESADTGGHYDAMIRDGIPRGVAFLKARDAEVHPDQ